MRSLDDTIKLVAKSKTQREAERQARMTPDGKRKPNSDKALAALFGQITNLPTHRDGQRAADIAHKAGRPRMLTPADYASAQKQPTVPVRKHKKRR